jgi:hypothetical protein
MAGTVIQDIKDFHDVVRLLEAHPEWRAELRRLVLTDDLLALPDQVTRLTTQVTALVDAQKRTDTQLAELVAAQRHTDAQVAALSEQVTRVTVHLQALAEAQRRTEAQLATLTEIAQRLSMDTGHLKGDGLEVRYALRGVPSITRVVRLPHTLSPEELDALLEEAETRGLLSAAESEEITLADLVIRGKQRGTEVYVVTEVSWGVGIDDVQRAAKRAALLAKTGRRTMAAVAGEWVTPDAQQLAPGLSVWQFTPSQVVPPAS